MLNFIIASFKYEQIINKGNQTINCAYDFKLYLINGVYNIEENNFNTCKDSYAFRLIGSKVI
jgi:hypothetical protein